MVVPDEIPVFLAQFRGTPFDTHHALVHGAGVGDQNEADVLGEEPKVGVDFGLFELIQAKIEHLLHGLRAMPANQFGTEPRSPPQASGCDRNIFLRVANRIDHMVGNDHHGAPVKAHRRGILQGSKADGKFLVLHGIQPVAICLKSLSVDPFVPIASPCMSPEQASRNHVHQVASHITEGCTCPRTCRTHEIPPSLLSAGVPSSNI